MAQGIRSRPSPSACATRTRRSSRRTKAPSAAGATCPRRRHQPARRPTMTRLGTISNYLSTASRCASTARRARIRFHSRRQCCAEHPPGATTMAYHSMPPLLRRWLAGVLAAQLGLGPLATPAYAALTPLADEPLNVKNSSKPNIVLTVDDSTSMLFDFLPDYVIGAYCRDGSGKMAAACGEAGMAKDFSALGFGRFISPGYISQQWKFPYVTYAAGWDDSGPGAGCDFSTF